MTLQTSLAIPSRGTALETRAKAIKILQDYYVDQAVDQGVSQHC